MESTNHILSGRHIKYEIGLDDQGYEIDIARERFESALLELINKGELSDSDHESNPEEKEKLALEHDEMTFDISHSNGYAILPSRPFKKKRRKEVESKDCGFHHTYVMRMFDRSVDLAQFGDSSPLYPICRAWMLNQPHKSDQLQINKMETQNSNAENRVGNVEPIDIDEKPVTYYSLPDPDPWPENILGTDPRVPEPEPPLESKRLDGVNKEIHISPALLLTEHLHRWRNIRNEWKAVGLEADTRYYKTFNILKTMFDGPSS